MNKENLPKPSEVKGLYAVEGGKKEEVEQDTDQHGRAMYDESIVQKIKHPDLIFIHKTIEMLMEVNLKTEILNPEEVGPIITMMEMLAEQESEVYNNGAFILPVNYFFGLWNCLNTSRSLKLYDKFPKKDKTLDHITLVIAKSLDSYHLVKKHEKKEGMVDDKAYLDYMGNMNKLQITHKKDKTPKDVFKNPFYKKLKGKS